MSAKTLRSRPTSVVVAVATTVAVAVFTVGVAALSLAAGHGVFSVGIAAALILWAALATGSAWLLWHRSGWARGPIVAIGAVHAFAYGQFGFTQGWAWLGSIAAAVSVIAALWPSTTKWLGFQPETDKASS